MNNTHSHPFSLMSIATVVLLALKVIVGLSFSWWWVLFPFAVYIGIELLLLLFVVLSVYFLARIKPDMMEELADRIENGEIKTPEDLKKFFENHQ